MGYHWCHMENRDIYVYPYGNKWAWKFGIGIAQKLYPDLETCLYYCRQHARQHEAKLYVEVSPGKFIRQKV